MSDDGTTSASEGGGGHKEAEWVTNAMLMGGLVKFRSYRQVLWNGI